jgi:hypothetical protein
MMTKRLTIALLALCGLLCAQSGTVQVNTTITATAGSGASAVSCVLSAPALPAVHLTCALGGTVYLTQDATPAVGASSGVSGTVVVGANSVTWLLQQPSAGTVTWQAAANGTAKNGTF